MSLKNKVAIVTGGNSGIGQAIVLELARQGASVVIDYVAHPEATERARAADRQARQPSIGVDADVSKLADLQKLIDAAVSEVRPPRHHGEQRRRRNTHLRPRHHRSAVRQGDGDKPQKRLLRHASRRKADDQAGRRRPHHQHQFGARGLADARQHRLLPRQGRHAHAHAHRRCRTRQAQYPRGRGGPGRGGNADQSQHDEDPAKLAKLDAAIPLGRMARPEEIASVVAFLAGDGASYLTATTIFADGGIMQSSVGL